MASPSELVISPTSGTGSGFGMSPFSSFPGMSMSPSSSSSSSSSSSLLLRPLQLSSRATSSMLASQAQTIPEGKRIQVRDDMEMTVSPSLSIDQCDQIRRACDNFMTQVFIYGSSWDVILPAVEIDPTCVMAHILATDYFIAKGDEKQAKGHVELARQHLSSHQCTDRERMYVDGYEQWLKGQTQMAAQTMEKILRVYPGDLFAVKRAQLFYFLLGDSQAMLRVVQLAPVFEAHENRPYFHGMLGFALSQNDQHDAAEEAGRKGVAIEPNDPWAHHAIAHAYYAKGKIKQGIQWLRENQSVWSSSMSFMHTHAWFHYILFILDAHDLAAIPPIFDQHIWLPNSTPITSTSTSTFPLHDKHNTEDQMGAIGLLTKWELRGAGVASHYVLGQRHLHSDMLRDDECTWSYVLPELTSRWNDVMSYTDITPHLNLFGLLQLYGLCRIGNMDRARTLLISMKESVIKLTDTTRKHILSQQLLPIATAICAFHNHEYKEAYMQIHPIMNPTAVPPIATPQQHSPVSTPRRSLLTSSPLLPASSPLSSPHVGPTLTRAASSTSSSSRSSSLLSYRIHATNAISGSDEQRDVIVNDLYLEILFHAHQFDILYQVVDDLIRYRDIPYFRAMRTCALIGMARNEKKMADQMTFVISKI